MIHRKNAYVWSIRVTRSEKIFEIYLLSSSHRLNYSWFPVSSFLKITEIYIFSNWFHTTFIIHKKFQTTVRLRIKCYYTFMFLYVGILIFYSILSVQKIQINLSIKFLTFCSQHQHKSRPKLWWTCCGLRSLGVVIEYFIFEMTHWTFQSTMTESFVGYSII